MIRTDGWWDSMPAKPFRITPRWISLRDAAAYSSIGEKRLVALAESGDIRGFRDPDSGRHDWVFDRDSIDAYREAQFAGSGYVSVELRVAEIMEKKRNREMRKGKR